MQYEKSALVERAIVNKKLDFFDLTCVYRREGKVLKKRNAGAFPGVEMDMIRMHEEMFKKMNRSKIFHAIAIGLVVWHLKCDEKKRKYLNLSFYICIYLYIKKNSFVCITISL